MRGILMGMSYNLSELTPKKIAIKWDTPSNKVRNGSTIKVAINA